MHSVRRSKSSTKRQAKLFVGAVSTALLFLGFTPHSKAAPTYGSFCTSSGLDGGLVKCGFSNVDDAALWGWTYSSLATNPSLFSYAGAMTYTPVEWANSSSPMLDPSNIVASTTTNLTNKWWSYHYLPNGPQSQYPNNLIGYDPTKACTPSTAAVANASLANDVYNPAGKGAAGYAIDNKYAKQYANGYAANVYSNGHDIIIAVRGTLKEGNNSTYNLLSDVSFLTGKPDQGLTYSVNELATLVAKVKFDNPGTEVSLTGHSLGGAIAQIVANATHVSATTFDAPGVQSLVGAFAGLNTTLPSNIFGAPTITNYRMYDDQVSLGGTPLETSKTITVNTPEGSTVSNSLNILNHHSISTLLEQLSNCAPQQDGEKGSNIATPTSLALNTVITTNGSVSTLVHAIANAVTDYRFDPAPGARYSIKEAADSPNIASLSLPVESGISGWQARSYDGSVWSPYTFSDSGHFTFGDGVTALDFHPSDALGVAQYNPDSFLLAMSFKTAGDFSATIEVMNSDGTVPEPSTMFLMLMAGLGLVAVRRMSR